MSRAGPFLPLVRRSISAMKPPGIVCPGSQDLGSPDARRERLHALAAAEWTGVKVKSLPSQSISTVSPALILCSRSAVASGLASRCWITRLSGRAP